MANPNQNSGQTGIIHPNLPNWKYRIWILGLQLTIFWNYSPTLGHWKAPAWTRTNQVSYNLMHILLWVQNHFGQSKSFWSSTNHFVQVQFILVSLRSAQNLFGPTERQGINRYLKIKMWPVNESSGGSPHGIFGSFRVTWAMKLLGSLYKIAQVTKFRLQIFWQF